MRRCVLGCPQGITLHKFPEDAEKRKEWLRMINMEDCQMSNLYLCTRHFARKLKGKSRLVWNAIPTRNLLGVDEDDIECDEIDQDDDDDDDAHDEPKAIQLPVKKSGILILPTKAKVIGSTGKTPFDPLYQPPKDVTQDQLVKHQIKFVGGRAIKVAQKKPATAVKENTKIEENSQESMPKRVLAPKTTSAEVIKHQIKIVDGKAYKIHVPVKATISKIQQKHIEDDIDSPINTKTFNKTPAQPVRKSTRTPKLRNVGKNYSTASVALEVFDEAEPLEKQSTDTIIEEIYDDENLTFEHGNSGSFKQSPREEQIHLKVEANDLSKEFDDLYAEEDEGEEQRDPQPQLYTGINKDQPVEFGSKIRSMSRQKVGFIECFVNNNTFCLTCFYCGTEFELWDWQQFIEHLNAKHIPKRKTSGRKYAKHNWEGSFKDETCKETSNNDKNNQTAETRILSPKQEEFMEDVKDVEMVVEEEDLEAILRGNVENEMQAEDSMDTYNENAAEDVEVIEEEDWQVDKLDEYEEIEVFEEQGSNIEDADVDIVEEEDDEGETEQQEQGEDEVGVGEFEDDDDEEEQGLAEDGDNNPDNVRQAIINFKTTDHSRVLVFLKLLRKQPMLWHPRRYGPPVFDEEMKKFIEQFDETMSPIEFRRSVENLRNQYKRFTPLTPRGRAKLQEDAFLRESVQIIKEIADKLSKPYVFHCDVCNFRFLDENRMLTHKYVRHKIGDLKFICSCGIRFAYERQKEEHENLHKLKPRFTCELCGSNFIFKRLLRDHMNESHPETQANPLPYKCSKCDAKFPSILKRGHHMERHKERKYHCEICKQSYTTSFRFKHHMKRHQDQRDWVCEHCGKTFIEQRALKCHRLRVHRDGGVKCVFCRTYFSSEETLDAHNQRFHPNGTNLDRMKKIRRHFNTKYRSRYRKPKVSTKVFKCKVCNEVMEDAWSLARHKRETGHDLEHHNCPRCEAVLSSTKSLMMHLQRVHQLPITTLAGLRHELLQANAVGIEQPTDGEKIEDTDMQSMDLKLEEIEIFETYDIE